MIEVITTKVVITRCCQYFEYAIAKFKDGNVKCTTTKVEYKDFAVFFFIYAISKSSCCRFVDDTKNFKTSNCTSIFSSLTLGVCKVSWNCNNSLFYRFAQVSFCISFDFLKNHCRNFLRSIRLIFYSYFVVCTHVTFNRNDCVFWVRYCLTFSQLTN